MYISLIQFHLCVGAVEKLKKLRSPLCCLLHSLVTWGTKERLGESFCVVLFIALVFVSCSLICNLKFPTLYIFRKLSYGGKIRNLLSVFQNNTKTIKFRKKNYDKIGDNIKFPITLVLCSLYF